MGILVMSDIVPPDIRDNSFIEGKIEELMDEKIYQLLGESELNIVNLECPLIDEGEKINKWGSYLKAPEESVNLLKKIPNLLVNLSNNHIRDYGDKGVLNTISILEKNGIAYVGAGKNIGEMKKASVHKVGQKQVAVFACTEHEFSHANAECAGANPIDDSEDIFTIQQLAVENDYVIVLYHGGCEFYEYPTPLQQKRLRNYIRAGANAVICQHSHCIGSIEEYQKGTIIYGQGGFLFADRKEVIDNIQNWDMWMQGMIVNIEPTSRSIRNIFYCRKDKQLVLQENSKAELELKERSAKLCQKNFVEEEWKRYCHLHKNYMSVLELWNEPPVGIIAKLKFILKKLLKPQRGLEEYLRVYDYLYCETHEELIKYLVNEEIQVKEKECVSDH